MKRRFLRWVVNFLYFLQKVSEVSFGFATSWAKQSPRLSMILIQHMVINHHHCKQSGAGITVSSRVQQMLVICIGLAGLLTLKQWTRSPSFLKNNHLHLLGQYHQHLGLQRVLWQMSSNVTLRCSTSIFVGSHIAFLQSKRWQELKFQEIYWPLLREWRQLDFHIS